MTDLFVKNAKWSGAPAGDKHTDGQGMYLHVTRPGKYWRMAYRYANKQKTLALGVYPAVSLAKARQKRDKARELLADGIDPGVAKREAKIALLSASANTFEAVALSWLEKTKAARGPKTTKKVMSWLKKDIFPSIGKMPISTIQPPTIMAVLRKAEARGAIETAHRVKQVCSQVFRFAVADGKAERDVTADLRGALAVPVKSNFAALTAPKSVGRLLAEIGGYRGHATVMAALRLAPMLFVRPGELRHAEWKEIDLDAGEWCIPGSKMKMGRDHIVPLARQAVTILRSLHPATGHARYVFPSIRTYSRPMSENTINAALRALGYGADQHTGHGFRALARTLLDEQLHERVDHIEHQLAHQVKDVHGRAYNRTEFLAERHVMMQRWADYLDTLRETAGAATAEP